MQLLHKWLISDLKELNTNRSTINRLNEELIELEQEYKSLKAKRYDVIPSYKGGNNQQEIIENNLARRAEIKLKLEAKRKHVENIERLLNQLSSADREIIECLVISHSCTAAEVGKNIGYEVRQIHNRKQEAIQKLLQMRFGQGYQA